MQAAERICGKARFKPGMKDWSDGWESGGGDEELTDDYMLRRAKRLFATT